MTPNNLASLRRLRWAVRAVLAVGLAASVAANVLHANPNPISQAISAWPPLALLLTVELVSRVPVHSRGLAAIRVLATAVIAGIAGWVSYWHMRDVAARYGETDTSAYLLPISVDGLIVVASICLVELAGRIRILEDPTGTASGASAVPDRPTLDSVAAAPVPDHVPAVPAGRPAVSRVPAQSNGNAPPETIATVPAGVPDEAAAEPAAMALAARPPRLAAATEPAGHGHVETVRISAPDDTAGGAAAAGRRAGAGPRNPASHARKTAAAAAKPARPAGPPRTDDELLAQLRAMPRDNDGSISVRRAATTLGTGTDRARRLLTQAGIRQPTTTDVPASPAGGDG